MEIMLNGQLVTCTPKEYKELMDMGLLPGQPAGTKAAPQFDEGWKDQLAEIAKRYPKIEPEKPKFGTCTVTPIYGCVMPAEEAIGDFNMDMHNISIAEKPTSAETITLQVKAEAEGKITVYLMQFNDSEEPTYISRDAYGRLDTGGADIKTSDITKALGFYDRERADDFAAVYNSHCANPTLTVVAKDMPVGTTLNRPLCYDD